MKRCSIEGKKISEVKRIFFALLWMIVVYIAFLINPISVFADNITVCGVDIGLEGGEYMQFTNANGTPSSSGYYYNEEYLYGSQCFGFAMYCQNRLFGYNHWSASHKYYNVTINGVDDVPAGQLTVDTLRQFIQASKPGAHLRTHPNSSGTAHSLIITEITDTGFSIVQCNGSNNIEYGNYKSNTVGTFTYTWDSYVNGSGTLSTYGKRGIDYIELPYDYPYNDLGPNPDYDWWLTDPLVYNDDFYAAANPDLAQKGIDTPEKRVNHWLSEGIAESVKGRQASPVFQAKWYLLKNPKVASDPEFGQSYETAIQHFVTNGVREWRDSSEEFNAEIYKENYKDLQEAFGDECRGYVEHYINRGRLEGRIANERLTNRFDANGGSLPENVPEICETMAGTSFGDLPVPTRPGYTFEGWFTDPNGGELITSSTQREVDEREVILYAHWTYNWWLTDPLVYNDDFYAAANPDLAQKGIDTPEKRVNHWLSEGIAESVKGRQASPVFQAKWYLLKNPKVASDPEFGQSYETAIQHFVTNGVREWRDSSEEFNAEIYKENYKDLQEAFGDECRGYVEHYINRGRLEGRIANERLTNRFDANGGSLPENVPEICETMAGTSFGDLPVPTRPGYTFEGWFTDPNGGELITSSTQREVDEREVILYAHWTKREYDLILPASLTVIDEEAFAGGSAFTCVKLSDNTESIGSRAFASCANLEYIYIPAKTTSIADDAFNIGSGLTIIGKEGSYAEVYAGEKGFQFIAE